MTSKQQLQLRLTTIDRIKNNEFDNTYLELGIDDVLDILRKISEQGDLEKTYHKFDGNLHPTVETILKIYGFSIQHIIHPDTFNPMTLVGWAYINT